MVAITMTKVTAPVIPRPVEIFLETPRKGQIPKNWLNTMLLTNMADMMIIK
jgi:hypothetical protein